MDWTFLRNPEFWAAIFAVVVIIVTKLAPDWADTFRELSPLLQQILLFIFGAIVVSGAVRWQALRNGYTWRNGKYQKVS